MRRTISRVAVVPAAVGALVMAAGQGAHAAPAPDGCPPGYQTLAVADLIAQGYVVAGLVDDPTSGVLSFGRPGNGNGLICARQMGHRVTHFGGPYFNFMDDGLPAS